MNIYFGGSITGGRGDVEMYAEFIDFLRRYGTVLTEHIGSVKLTDQGENLTAKEIHDRDVAWIKEADIVVADVSVTSLGVGYELGLAVSLRKPVVCLYRENGKRLSGMIDGCDKIKVVRYADIEDAKTKLKAHLEQAIAQPPRQTL